MNKPDLYTLLKQFNAIGGIAQTGQPGFCLLMALWQKANELNWVSQFTMTNAELLYKAGFNNVQSLTNARNKLKQLRFIDYIPPRNRKYCGTYVLNYDLISLKNIHYSTTLNSNLNSSFNSPLNSSFNSPFNSGFNSSLNINKLNQTNNLVVGVVEEETAAADDNLGLKNIVEYFNSNIHPITPIEYEKIQDWLNEMEPDAIIFAIEEAVNQSKRSMSYIEGILRNYLNLGIRTREAAKAYKRDWKDMKNREVKNNAANRKCDKAAGDYVESIGFRASDIENMQGMR